MPGLVDVFVIVLVDVFVFVLLLSLMFFCCTVYVLLFAVLLCQRAGTALIPPAVFKVYQSLLCCVV